MLTVDADGDVERTGRAVLPRLVFEVGIGPEVVGHVERMRSSERDLALDPVGAEDAHLVDPPVKADPVPLTEFGQQTPWFDLALASSVREGRGRPSTVCVEERRERLADRKLRDRERTRALHAAE